jgi:hypothetical protein
MVLGVTLLMSFGVTAIATSMSTSSAAQPRSAAAAQLVHEPQTQTPAPDICPEFCVWDQPNYKGTMKEPPQSTSKCSATPFPVRSAINNTGKRAGYEVDFYRSKDCSGAAEILHGSGGGPQGMPDAPGYLSYSTAGY